MTSGGGRGPGGGGASRGGGAGASGGGAGASGGGDRDSPGRSGPAATREVDPRGVGAVAIAYNPVTDGDADPGEIVWTWVPYEENDGRGKDRPVLVVAAEPGGTLLGVQLTSKPHDDSYDVGIGSGPWDSAGRPSWVRLERVLRLHQGGIRREAVALDAERFALVAAALTRRYAWRTASSAPSAAVGPAGPGRVPALRTPARGAASASSTPARGAASAPRTTFGSLLRRLFSR